MINKFKEKLFRTGQDKVAEVVEKNSGETGARVKRYIQLIATGDVEGLFKALLDDMDKENILAEVREMQARYPDLSPQELSRMEINTTAKAMSGVAVGSGLSWVLPGVALLTGPLATMGEIIGLFVFQSRLVVKISAYYGLDISSTARSRDVAVCVACSSASIGGARIGGKALERVMVKFGQKLAETVTKKLAQIGIKSVPGFGALAGLAGGVVGAVSNYCSIKAVGAYALKMYGDADESVDDDRFDKAIIYVTVLTAQVGGVISGNDREFLKNLINNSAMANESKQELLVKINSELKLADIGSGFTHAENIDLLITAIKISMRDELISDEEYRFIEKLGSFLKVKETEIEQLITDYCDTMTRDFKRQDKDFLSRADAENNPFVIHL